MRSQSRIEPYLTRHSGFAPTAAIMAIALLACSAAVLLLHLAGFDAVAALRDGRLSDRPEAGLISDLGIAVMVAAGAFAIVRGLWGRHVPIAAAGAFCMAFALDDALMLHERLGSLEVLAFAGYGLGVGAMMAAFRPAGSAWIAWPLALTLAAFVASAGIDVAWQPLVNAFAPAGWHGWLARVGYCLEDVPKFGGIVVLAAFVGGEAIAQGRRAGERGATA